MHVHPILERDNSFFFVCLFVSLLALDSEHAEERKPAQASGLQNSLNC